MYLILGGGSTMHSQPVVGCMPSSGNLPTEFLYISNFTVFGILAHPCALGRTCSINKTVIISLALFIFLVEVFKMYQFFLGYL
jgi:hypothetical protein